MREPRHRAHFLLEAFAELGILGDVIVHHLEHDRAVVEADVFAEVNAPHPAFAQEALHFEALQIQFAPNHSVLISRLTVALEERTEGADPHGANPGEGSPCSAMRSPKFRTRKAIVPAQARNFFSQGQSAAGRSGGAGRGCNPIRYFTYISGWQTCQASSSILARGSFYLYGRRKYRPARRGTA